MAEPEFVRLDPAPTWCGAYGSGTCCWDKHFDIGSVISEKALPEDYKYRNTACQIVAHAGFVTTDKAAVNCKECRELIHS